MYDQRVFGILKKVILKSVDESDFNVLIAYAIYFHQLANS